MGDSSAGDQTGRSVPDAAHVRDALAAFATEFLVLVTPKGELVAATEFNTLGYTGQERAGHHVAEHLHPDDLPLVFDVIERARRTAGFEETIEVRARHKDGTWRMLQATVIDAAVKSDLRGAVLRIRDITEEHAKGVAQSEPGADRFLSLAEMLPLGILSADARGFVAFCNEAAQQIFNLPGDHLLGHGWESTIHSEDLADVATASGQVVRTGAAQQVTFRIATGLSQRWAHAKFVALGAPRAPTGWIATVEDITDRRRAESQLAHQATHDPLTGLPNRTLLEDRLRQATGRMRRDASSVTVLFVDLDGFKDVNDTHGHGTGDAVLIEAARRLRAVVRDVDTVARLGGDEFVAVCESLPSEEVASIVERIHDALAVPMIVEGTHLVVGASVGVASTSDAEVDVADLLARADQSMYRDKQDRKRAHG